MSGVDPTVVQQRAAFSGASVWVAASAGTGKTKVLTDRVLALMLAGSAPTRLLCLTFTKAAAAEMANRLNDRLSAWTTLPEGELTQELAAITGAMPSAKIRDKARRLFAEVLDAPGGMRIGTIHAFCQSLLRRFPIEAQIPPYFEPMDDRDAGDALAAARDEVLVAARAAADPALAMALQMVTRHLGEDRFDTVIDALIKERARLTRALGAGFDGFCRRLRERLGVAADTSAATVLANACAPGAADEPALLDAGRAMTASASVRDRTGGAAILAWLEDIDAREARFDDYLLAFFTKKGEPRKDIVTRKLAAQPAIADAVAGEAERLAEVIRALQAVQLFDATAALARLGVAMLKAYERKKRERAQLDYDDLILTARDLLHRPGVAPWVLFKLDGGLDHILIDEAQDTNPEQWEIVEALANEFFTGEGARAERRTIFAVGDAKQSIFSFQRADPQAFLRMRNHFAERVAAAREEWRIVDLDTSFRSTAPVLAVVDGVFASPEARDGVALDATPIRHHVHRRGQAGVVELWPPVEPIAAPEPTPWELPLVQQRTREPMARLASVIAATLRGWFDNGEILESRGRALRPGDILVLVRRRGTFVAELARALKQAGVPVAGTDRMLLTEQLAVEDLLALAQFLLLPEDDLMLATVLKGPLFGIDDDLLFRLAHDRGDRSLWSELRRRVHEHPLFARAEAELSELLGGVDYTPPFELFADILATRGGRRAMEARLGTQVLDPLDELLAAALRFETIHGSSLQGFLHWLAAGDTEIKRDLDQRGRDEVRIMTVHGAKGLEAPVVFLPDTMQVPTKISPVLWTEDGLPLWRAHDGCGAPAFDLARSSATARRDEEYRRLLYVALTRAQDRLYVCGWRTKRSPGSGSWHRLVANGLASLGAVERFDFDTTTLLPGDGWSGEGLRLVAPQTARPIDRQAAEAPAATAAVLPLWVNDPAPPEPTPARPLAPSQPAQSEPAVRSPLGADEGAGFQRGRIIHRLLQSLPELEPAAREAAGGRFLGLAIHGLAPDVQAAILRETLAVLDDPTFAPLFGPGSAAEVPVVGLLGDRALSGQIDRLVVTDDAVLIVDYKTLRPPPRTEAEVPAIYLEQLATYRAAVAKIYPDRPVRCALLWTDGPRLMEVTGLSASPGRGT